MPPAETTAILRDHGVRAAARGPSRGIRPGGSVVGQKQDPPFPLIRRRPSPDGRPPLNIPRKPHRQDTKSELKNHPPFIRLPSLSRIRGGPDEDLGSAEMFPYPCSNGPHRPGPRGGGRPERLPRNSIRNPDLADRQRGKDRRRAAIMVLVGVGQREDVDPPDSLVPQ